jgi:hypothetical protein
VQTDLVGEFGPGELTNLEHVVEEFDEFIGARANGRDGVRLLDRGHMTAHVMNTARRRADDIVVAREAVGKKLFTACGVGLAAVVGHGLAAAGLRSRVVHVEADTFKQLQRGDTDLGIKRVDKARDEQRDFQACLTGSAVARAAARVGRRY